VDALKLFPMCGGLVVRSVVVFLVTVFIWSRGPAVDRPMCFPYSKYCIRMRFRMLRNGVMFDRFGTFLVRIRDHFAHLEHACVSICRSADQLKVIRFWEPKFEEKVSCRTVQEIARQAILGGVGLIKY